LDRDAVALRAHRELAGFDMRAVQGAEELKGFRFHLLFFFGDVGDHVSQDVERCHSGITGAAYRLHCDRYHLIEAEVLLYWRESQDQSDGGAVGIRYDEAARFASPALTFEHLQVAGVDLGNDEWNILFHAERAGI